MYVLLRSKVRNICVRVKENIDTDSSDVVSFAITAAQRTLAVRHPFTAVDA